MTQLCKGRALTMEVVQQIFFERNGNLVRLTYVPDFGINAETGAVVDGVFIPRREDQFEFTDHAELVRMYSAQSGAWDLRIVNDFLSGDGKPQETDKEIEAFNEWMNAL